MRTWFIISFLSLTLLSCEPFDLKRKTFPTCAKPSATIGFTADRLDVTLFAENPQGDIGLIGWDFGDNKGVNRVGTRVAYNYEKAGTYVVTMTIANTCDDIFTTTYRITVRNQ
ncbi:PKD domain-containing protein [Spirosoma oryzicola]|uniref:PKD domain-containing protein n=1 Tax=Spirosoma oryzicola TaxID=2898794 RepID=UPI001E5BCFD2|nr:PKD domain-containing protein [Spirosoma oryzicola]UHG89934.1 PKD domain-containing protein [Spirosoma oryzicola]